MQIYFFISAGYLCLKIVNLCTFCQKHVKKIIIQFFTLLEVLSDNTSIFADIGKWIILKTVNNI